jgi:hypothetical protein
VSFAAVTLCVASLQVFFVVVVYFVIDSVRKLLDTPSYQSVGCSLGKQWCTKLPLRYKMTNFNHNDYV